MGYGQNGAMSHDECEAKCPKCNSNCKVAMMTTDPKNPKKIVTVSIYCGNGSCTGWSTTWETDTNKKIISN